MGEVKNNNELQYLCRACFHVQLIFQFPRANLKYNKLHLLVNLLHSRGMIGGPKLDRVEPEK